MVFTAHKPNQTKATHCQPNNQMASHRVQSPMRNVGTKAPLANIFENENEWKIMIAIPGFTKEEIKTEVKDQILTVTAVKSSQDAEVKIQRKEWNLDNVKRSFQLPKDADIENIGAENAQGLLTITIPKNQVKTSKIIEIK
jgi:HSP20 family protein